MREWNKKWEVMRNYDGLAKVYDAQYAEEQNAMMKESLNNVNLREDSFLLDVGCGTGLLFEHVGESIKLLVGLDVSLEILKEAKKHVKYLPKMALVRADADFTPFLKRVFDVVFAITLLQNMPHPLLTLHEMMRVSKQNSTIVVTGLKKKFSKNAFIALIREAGVKASVIKTNDKMKGYVATIENEV